MARMFPEEYISRYIDPNDPNRAALEQGEIGEKLVYDALKENLPDEWVVIHDYWRYFVDSRTGEYENYESDFIVLVPYKGIVVLEVKNSKSLELIDGSWRMNGNQLLHHKESPLNQSYASVLKLKRELNSTMHWDASPQKLNYGSLAILLQQKIDYLNNKRAAKVDEHIAKVGNCAINDLYVCGRDCLAARLQEKIDKVLGPTKWFSYDEVDRVVRYMLPSFVFKKDPKVCAALIDKAAEPATMLLPMLHKNSGGIHVTGVAGTGKTWMLCSEVKRLRRLPNNKILVLCYNKPLSLHLKKQLLEQVEDENVEVYTIDGFFRKIIKDDFTEKQSGMPLYSKKELDIIQERLKLPQYSAYTHVFIDECQDVLPLYWRPLLGISSRLYMFSDSNQTLYRNRNMMPACAVYVELTRNLRNSLDIATFCNQMLTNKAETLKLKCEEVVLKEGVFDVMKRAEIVDSIIKDLRDKNVPYGDIVILTPNSTNNCIPHLKTRTREVDGEKMPNKTIAWSTIKRYKGLESCFVILADVSAPNNEGGFTDNDLYVACTRAKYGLYIVPSDDGNWLKNMVENTRKELADYEDYC